jgi:hypothetical protein
MWRGPSGTAIAPTQVMDVLANGLALLERDGWDPTLPFGIHQAIGGNDDVRRVAERCLDAIVAYRAGSQWADFEAWERVAGRTFLEVQDIMTATGWYAAAAGAGVKS